MRGVSSSRRREVKVSLAIALQVAPIANAPRFLVDVDARADLFVTHPQRFPEFTGAAFARGVRLRKRRRERCEAVALTVKALARHLDRRTLRVGDQRDDGLCNGVTVVRLCRLTGLSRSRQTRALAELESAGYVSSMQPVVKLPAPRARRGGRRGMQTHVGMPAVRTVRPLLLQRQGFTAAKVNKNRRRGYDDWQRRRGKVESAVAVLGMRRDLSRLYRSIREREGRLAGAAVLAEPHVRPPGTR
jgi:hypothetical protein